MRLMTWNVNGIKTLPQWAPWNGCGGYEGIVNRLGADILCVQETKITRSQLEKSMACMDDHDAFYSFYRRTPARGIHGTAIFTRREMVVPLKAEEGIGGALAPGIGDERIGGYPWSSDITVDEALMKDIDMEGRTTVIDCGLFVLINLYCPNETNEHRLVYKNAFNEMVDARVRGLMRLGREVIVVGDLNICCSNLDTAEPEQRAKEQGIEEFTDHPPRKWLKEFVGPKGVMIDTTRRWHPERKGMFTCWNTKIDARPSNYGTRLDYILITPGLLPWIKNANTHPDIKGSDHAPVTVDFYDEIDHPTKGRLRLWEELNPGRTREDPLPLPPSFAACHYKEFKQTTLASFFGKKPAKSSVTPTAPKAPSPSASAVKPVSPSGPVASTSTLRPSTSRSISASQPVLSPSPGPTSSSSAKGKTKASTEEANPSPHASKAGQQNLSSFFRPPPARTESKEKTKSKKPKTVKRKSKTPAVGAEEPDLPLTSSKKQRSESLDLTRDSPELPHEIETQESERPGDDEIYDWRNESGLTASMDESKDAWGELFKPKAVPLCDGHGEPSKLWTVNKPGINKGRRFYLCSRPVGTGYDQGQSKEKVNPDFRCNFFSWETNVKRPATIGAQSNVKKRKT